MSTEEVKQLGKSMDAGLIETHISYILLTKKFAFKIKKEIKTSFLNYSTIKMRRRMCQEEFRLNKILSKGIYLSVESIYKSGSSILIGTGKGRRLDYCVKMKKLDGSKKLDVMVKGNQVSTDSVKKLAKLIAHFHSKATKSKLKKYDLLWQQFYDLNALIERSDLFSSIELKKIKIKFDHIHQFLLFNRPRFEERDKSGCIKDLHGDLHTGNVFMYSKPIVFDRIEFNAEFRLIDVLHEVAFLCMDFEALGRADLSKHFLNFYLKSSRIVMEENIFLFYKCYSANVRAKVNLLSYRDSGKKKYLKEFLKYYKLMLKYMNVLFLPSRKS